MLRAYFTYVTSGLSVDFINLSSGGPDSFSWNFGVTEGTSTTESPTFLFPAPGVYDVTLTITKSTVPPETDTVTLKVGVSATGIAPSYLIIDGVLSRLPEVIQPSLQDITQLINKWQRFLADLIDPNIPESTMFNELVWPPLVNELIVNLVLYDIITDLIMGSVGASLSVTTSDSESGTVTTTGTTGGVKRIQTGPAEVEYFQNTSAVSEAVANLTKSSGGAPGGFYSQLQKRICILTSRLRIPMEICPELSKDVFAPTILSPI